MKTGVRTTALAVVVTVFAHPSVPRPRYLPLDQTLETFLDGPMIMLDNGGLSVDDFKQNSIAAEHVRIALSNLAEGCANFGLADPVYYQEAKDCVATVVAVATDPSLSPYEEPVEQLHNLGNHGLYLSHLNIVLGSWMRLTNDDSYRALNQRISEYLARKTLSDPQRNIPSYPTMDYRWPADQTATLYSLWLYDQNYETTMSQEPVEEWLAYMNKEGKDTETGLYISEVTGTYPYADTPRGCALSWSIRYMAAFAPEEAAEQWNLYKEKFKKGYGPFTGFREWPRGYNGPEDADSGPILLGNGVAATAFAVGASTAVGDEEMYAALARTEAVGRSLVDAFAFLGSRDAQQLGALADDFLGRAITFNMHSIE